MKKLIMVGIAVIGYFIGGWGAILLIFGAAIILTGLDNIPKDNCKYCGGRLIIMDRSKAWCAECGKDQQ